MHACMRRLRSRPRPLSDEQLREAAPCDVVRRALPQELAGELLAALLADAPGWARGQWIMFGKTHDAPRTSCFYSLDDSAPQVIRSTCSSSRDLCRRPDPHTDDAGHAPPIHACGRQQASAPKVTLAAGAGCGRLQGCVRQGGPARRLRRTAAHGRHRERRRAAAAEGVHMRLAPCCCTGGACMCMPDLPHRSSMQHWSLRSGQAAAKRSMHACSLLRWWRL